jgi:hypothetical protein
MRNETPLTTRHMNSESGSIRIAMSTLKSAVAA